MPHRAFNHDTDQAIASLRKLAAMEPATVWPGHANPVTGDVRGAAGAGGRRGIATLVPRRQCPGWDLNPHVPQDSGF